MFKKLQSPPNVLIAFSSNSRKWNTRATSEKLQELSLRLPSQLSMIYADHYCIQQGAAFQETEGDLVVLLGSFPEALTASCLLSNAQVEAALGETSDPAGIDALLAAGGIDATVDWKVFIVNVCPRASGPHSFIAALTKRFPRASIMGGVSATGCTATSHKGVFSSTMGDVKRGRESSVSILALAGNCPLHCLVSRGVEPVSPLYSLHDVTSEEEESVFLASKFESAEEMGKMMTVNNVVHGLNHAMQTRFNDGLTAGLLLGSRLASPPHDADPPFWLVPLSDSHILDTGIALEVYSEFGQPTPNQMRIYRLSNKACMADVPRALELAKARFADLGAKVMGCILFSCTGRGPRADFFSSDAYDARTFLSIFPGTPLIGTYVNGEVGPNAMADATSQTIFREGHATLQGFTAVFGIFAVPEKKKVSALYELLSGSAARGPVSAQEFVSDLLRTRRES